MVDYVLCVWATGPLSSPSKQPGRAQAEAEALRSRGSAALPRPLVQQPSLPAPGAPTATLRLGSLSLGCHKIDWAAEESEAEEVAA